MKLQSFQILMNQIDMNQVSPFWNPKVLILMLELWSQNSLEDKKLQPDILLNMSQYKVKILLFYMLSTFMLPLPQQPCIALFKGFDYHEIDSLF